MIEQKRILILGGGFGGIRCALDLSTIIGDKALISLISQISYHCYSPDLYEVASAKLEKEGRLEFRELRGTINIPYRLILKNKVEFHEEKVELVDLEACVVKTSLQSRHFDFLVVSLGSVTSFFGIAGADQFSHPIKTAEDALNIRNDLEELLREKQGDLRLVIAGGGFSGVELAGELSRYLPKRVEIVILEAMESILVGMPSWSQKEAKERLEKLGIKIKTNHQIVSVSKDSIFCKEKDEIKFDYLIWTSGIKGKVLEEKIKDVEFNKKDQIIVENNLSLKNFPNVFVIGDLAALSPPTAWAAIAQGKLAAENISRKINGWPLLSFSSPHATFIVPIGGKYALTNLFGFEMTGISIWFLKQFVALRYFLSILSVNDAIRIWWKGVNIFVKND